MLYNDRAVLENHHVSAAYRLLQRDEDINFLSNLSKDDWRCEKKISVSLSVWLRELTAGTCSSVALALLFQRAAQPGGGDGAGH